MRRTDTHIALPYVAVLLNAVTWCEAVLSQAPEILGLTLAVQVITGLAIVCEIRRERQVLGVAVAVSMPIIGPLATAFVDRTRGRSAHGLLAEPGLPHRAFDGLDVARALVSCPPPCEAIVSGSTESRRAAIGRLADRAAHDDIAILRWARNQQDSDVAVEAALALEDVGQRFDDRIAAARQAVAATPSAVHHIALVHAIAEAMVAGLVDMPLVGKLADEARTHYEAAISLDPSTGTALAEPRARVELAADNPTAALDALAPVITTSADEHIARLHDEAAYAARRFDLVRSIARQKAVDAGC